MNKKLAHNTRKSLQIIVYKSLKSQLSALVLRKIGKLASFSNFEVVFLGNYAPAPFFMRGHYRLIFNKEIAL
jgi:hypothetical protein